MRIPYQVGSRIVPDIASRCVGEDSTKLTAVSVKASAREEPATIQSGAIYIATDKREAQDAWINGPTEKCIECVG